MSQRKSLKTLVLALAAVLFTGVIVSGQTYSGQAFAGKLNTKVGAGLVSVSPTILDTGDLPAAGGDINLGPAVTAAIPTSGSILSLTNSQSRTRSTGAPGAESAVSTAGVDSTSITFGGLGISTGVITSSATAACPNNLLSHSGSVANLVVGGVIHPVLISDPLNITINVGTVTGELRVNEVLPATSWSVTRNALHLIVTDSLTNTTLDLVVASSRAGIDCGIAPTGQDIFGGRGTALRISQNTLSGLVPVGYLSADTGPLPTIGSAQVNAATAAVPLDLAGVISVGAGALTSTTAGGDLGGTPDQTDSTSTVANLNVSVTVVGIATVQVLADSITSKTRCSVDALQTPTCTVVAPSEVVGLRVVVTPLVGPPIVVLPDQGILTTPGGINLALPLGLGSITLAWNTTNTIGTPAWWITRTGLQVGLNVTGITATNIEVARSFSSIRGALAPSAADVTLSGRVTTANGRAISRARISVIDSSGSVRSSLTNSFGYYSIKGIPSGEFYIVSASAKGYTFSPQAIMLTDNVSGFDFHPNATQTVSQVPITRSASPKVAEASPVRKTVSTLNLSEPDPDITLFPIRKVVIRRY